MAETNDKMQLPSLSAAQFRDLILQVVKEAKAPTAEEQARLDLERERTLRRSKQRRTRYEREEHTRRIRQETCAHVKVTITGGRIPCIGGQLFSNGIARVFCLRCQMVLKEFKMDIPFGASVDMDFSRIDMTDVFAKLERERRERGVKATKIAEADLMNT